jgi:hypothetical protein
MNEKRLATYHFFWEFIGENRARTVMNFSLHAPDALGASRLE